MKKNILFFISILLLNCSLDDNSEIHLNNIKWNLINISGGIAGNSINLQQDDITWVFNEVSNQVVIEYNISNDHAGLLKSGIYNYEIRKINNKTFLFINNTEVGNIIMENNRFIIDQNILSTGNAADLYVLTFER